MIYFKKNLLKVMTINWCFMDDDIFKTYSVCLETKLIDKLTHKLNNKVIRLTWSNLPNLSKSLMLQNSCRLMLEAMIRRHIVNRIRCPSFFPGPKICNKHKYSDTLTEIDLDYKKKDTKQNLKLYQTNCKFHIFDIYRT